MRPRLLFVYLKPTSFVCDDLALLREHFDVRAFHFDAVKERGRTDLARRLATAVARQRRWLREEMPRANVLYGWFADYHLTLPVRAARRYGVPVAVAVGGYDANAYPEVGYGVATSWRAPLARRILKGAHRLLPVTASLVCDDNAYLDPSRVRRTGLCTSFPDLTTPTAVVPLGVDPAAWPAGPDRRAPVVTTVAFLGNDRTVRIKGVDLFIEAARRLPDVRFEVVGVESHFRPVLESSFQVPANVALLPPMPREGLVAQYHRASVYTQLSRLEGGLPMVLAEAMLCGCVPVGSRVGGIPETIGEAGLLVDRPDPARIAEAIGVSLERPPQARQDARARVAAHFSLAQRGERLQAILHRLVQAAKPDGRA